MPNSSISERGVQEFRDPKLANLVPHLPRQAVHEVEVDMIGLQPLKLLIQEPVHVRPALDKPTGELRRQMNVPSHPLQRLTQEHLALARLEWHLRMINERRIEVIDPVADGIIHHCLGFAFVDQMRLVANDRQAHTAKAQNREPLAGLSSLSIQHTRLPSISAAADTSTAKMPEPP